MSTNFITNYRELSIYQVAFESAMQVFEIAQRFPEAERQLLTEHMVRSSRSVCINLVKAWQKRRYQDAFVAKMNQVEVEAAETQTWLEFAILCGYLDAEVGQELFHQYAVVLSAAARLIENADAWVIQS